MSNQDPIARALADAWRGSELECPPPASLLPAELRVMPAADRRRIEEHLRGCPACAAEAELAAAFEASSSGRAADVDWVVARLEGSLPPVAAGQSRSPAATVPPAPLGPLAPVVPIRRRQPARILLPLAAAVLVALGSALVLRELDLQPAGRLPDRRAGDVTRGAFLDSLAPRGELSQPPGIFEWTPVEDATAYVVTVRSVDGTVLWSGRAGAAERVESTPELLERLQPRVRYLWQVEAVDASGAVVAASEPADFVVRPGGGGDAADTAP